MELDLYIYSDESGVFDKRHNEYFVFGGLIFLSKEDRDIAARKYVAAENAIRAKGQHARRKELKASVLKNGSKGKLYRSLNQHHKFGAMVNQAHVLDSICSHKKSKQRYLDYVYKLGAKCGFSNMIESGIIRPNEVVTLNFYVDEHTTATDGRYELREALEQEFKFGTHNANYSMFYPPIFHYLQSVNLLFCNSCKNTLVRAADIVANHIYHKCVSDNMTFEPNLHLKKFGL